MHQRSDLEDTFDLDQEELEHSTESHQLLSRTSTPHQAIPIPHSNDGVFSNMAAKPESDSFKLDQVPPVSHSV